MATLKRQLGFFSAAFAVIGTMIGSGVFLTGSELYFDAHASKEMILALWALGGLVAISGALSYAELAAFYPEAGGEFAYLNRIFGRLPAFLTGWISLLVGFSAPIALTSLSIIHFGNEAYTQLTGLKWIHDPMREKLLAGFIPILLALFHLKGVKTGGSMHNAMTALKTILTFAFAAALFNVIAPPTTLMQPVAKIHGAFSWGMLLLSVMFSYSGWNAASYLGAEVKNPEKNLPRALVIGTLITAALYLMLNYNFLRFAGINIEHTDLAVNAARSLFGNVGAAILSALISFFLLSSVSAEVMIGPRVYYAMAEKGLLFKKLAEVHSKFGTPAFAILLQTGLSVIYILAFGSSILNLLIFMGFALSFFPWLTVLGLLVQHSRDANFAQRAYRSPLFPLFPVIFLTATLCMMVASLIERTQTSLIAVGITVAGGVAFFIWENIRKKYSGNA